MRDPVSTVHTYPFTPLPRSFQITGTRRAPRAKIFPVEGEGEAVWKHRRRGSSLVGEFGGGATALTTCSKGNSARNRVGPAVAVGAPNPEPQPCIPCRRAGLHHHHVIHPSIRSIVLVFRLVFVVTLLKALMSNTQEARRGEGGSRKVGGNEEGVSLMVE